ncbi:hypothetical protein NQ314_000820 [Rhamnusium bicolor]|uniref:HTH psq-type domain-containing protein n=1 Tax=Rhamnusium bicolor TaxID=1586634 RepID=A0AAV8ZX20_9CUCU|nr:hypothetical protein NQ314_000820 [Rhamnusium bicolor]
MPSLVNGVLSIHAAARTHNIAYGTLHNRFHGCRIKTTGGQTVLTANEEEAILSSILKCSDWGFPLIPQDVRMFVKIYLDKTGRVIHRFSDNLPGSDWEGS